MSENHFPFSLKGKTILITGASSGIGKQTAISCAENGATIVLAGRNAEKLLTCKEQLTGSAIHQILVFDLTSYAEIEDVFSDLGNKGIILDGMVHSAGISTTLPLKMSSPEKIETIMQVNAIAGIELCRLILKNKLYSKNGMSIVFISSVMGLVGERGKTMYSLSKGAINAGVKSMALELAPKGIRVNSISPGVVISPLSGKSVYSQDPESLEKVRANHPLGFGNPEDVANACIYLLSHASRWVTGSDLVVDGGYTAR